MTRFYSCSKLNKIVMNDYSDFNHKFVFIQDDREKQNISYDGIRKIDIISQRI